MQAVRTNTIAYTTSSSYSSMARAKEGYCVVALNFANEGDGDIRIGNRTLAPKSNYDVPIPCGCFNYDVFNFTFIGPPGTLNGLLITETVTVKE